MNARGCRRSVLVATVLSALSAGGCTRESVRLALDAQRRADGVQQAVFDRQHQALCALLYRDLVQRLERAAAQPMSPHEREIVNAAWNDRDLLEFWAVQHERARALRLAGVDAKLFADQSPVDLLIKQADARVDRVIEAAAEYAGSRVGSDKP